jgi:dihydroxy-acid dehydratase
VRSEKVTQEELLTMEGSMCRSTGHCAVMGTASTMACMVESLGLSLPGNAAILPLMPRVKCLATTLRFAHCRNGERRSELSDVLHAKQLKTAIIANAGRGAFLPISSFHLLGRLQGRIGVGA